MLRPAAMQPGTGLNCAPTAVPIISLLALLKSQHAAAESVCSQAPHLLLHPAQCRQHSSPSPGDPA